MKKISIDNYYKDWSIEDYFSGIKGDAHSIRRIVDDINERVSPDDANRLHAVMKLAEDQMRMAGRAVDLLNK